MIAETLVPEFDFENQLTRTILERVPDDKASWKPHPKSMTLGQLAAHLANLPGLGKTAMAETEFNVSPANGESFNPPQFGSTAENLSRFDANTTAMRGLLEKMSDDDFRVTWALKRGETTMLSMTRVAVVRGFILKHIVHHRGQMTVYLRMLDVPLPSIYGPTADTL
jgi:uncharacterized damage-inducible protein DinB